MGSARRYLLVAPSPSLGIVGPYRLLHPLGQGGMAEVFLAIQRGPAGFQKLIVIKRLRGGMGNDPHFERMFMNEARLAARLNHPNVVQTFEVGVDGPVHFIAMEYLAGQPVNKVLSHAARNPTAFPLAVRLQIISDCLAGLDYAHDLADFDGRPLGIVHRDISPHNVFVTYDGVTKVVDFGIAKTTESPQFAEMSTAGALKGKIRYMAPEQLRGERLDRRADIFSMGVLLWEAIANGGRMWADDDDITVIMSLSDGITKTPEHADPNIDPELAHVVRRALAGNVDERYRTADAFRVDLDRYLTRIGGPISAREIGAYIQTAFEADRRRLDNAVRDALDDAEAELDNAQTVLRSRESIEAALASSGHSSEALNALFRRPSNEHNSAIPRIEHSTSAVVVAPAIRNEISASSLLEGNAPAAPGSRRASTLVVGTGTLCVVMLLGGGAALKLRAPTSSPVIATTATTATPSAQPPMPLVPAVTETTAAALIAPTVSGAPSSSVAALAASGATLFAAPTASAAPTTTTEWSQPLSALPPKGAPGTRANAAAAAPPRATEGAAQRVEKPEKPPAKAAKEGVAAPSDDPPLHL